MEESTDAKKSERLETEPIFGIHIDFADKSNPVVYYNLSLARAMDVLKEWCENYILAPDKDCKLNDAIWYWHAWLRSKNRIHIPDLFDLLNEDCDEDEEIEHITEDELNKED